MSIDRFYTESFIPQTWTAGSSFPYENTWTDGTAFYGAIDTISGNERWADAQIVAISTHWISAPTSISLNKNQRIKWGSRIFEVTAIPDLVSLKKGHHQEIYVKEIT